jgi:hypothetical protein
MVLMVKTKTEAAQDAAALIYIAAMGLGWVGCHQPLGGCGTRKARDTGSRGHDPVNHKSIMVEFDLQSSCLWGYSAHFAND